MGLFLNNYTHPTPILSCNHHFHIHKIISFTLLLVHSYFIFTMLLCILCIYLSLYFNVHIIVVGLYYSVGILRWVLDHLLSYVWEVPLGGRNPIPPRHLGILLLLPFNFMSSHLLSSNPHLLLNYVIPFISIPIPFILYHPI